MLTDKDIDIKKFIRDRISQIDYEVVNEDPEYQQLGSARMNYWSWPQPNCRRRTINC